MKNTNINENTGEKDEKTESKEKLITAEIRKMEAAFNENPLPSWDELPNLDLYMDQVIILLNRYLSVYAAGGESDKFITASMINNYVKLKIMPAPVKKRYTRIHLAYLIIICLLKQTLSMSTIQKIIPVNLSEERITEAYTAFSKNQKKALANTEAQIKSALCANKDNCEGKLCRIDDLIIQTAISSNLTKLLTEKLVNMEL